jgi:nucleoid DNA-binding protein
MTKADIARQIQNQVGISGHDAETLFARILDLLKAALKNGEKSLLPVSVSS